MSIKTGHARAVISLAAFYAHRIITIAMVRALIVAAIRTYVRWRHKPNTGAAPHGHPAATDALRVDGYAPLGQLLPRADCMEMIDYLNDKLLNDRDTPRPPFRLIDAPAGVRLADYGFADVVNCPHVVALANCPLLLGIAASYLGCKPTLSSVVLRWSWPCAHGTSDLQRFHRDADDWRFFKVLVYLTDVDEQCGPHVYVKATHRGGRTMRLRFWSDEQIAAAYSRDRIAVALGRMGSAFAVDTAGIHKGLAPTRGARLMLMLRYSLLPCYESHCTPTGTPRPSGLDGYINRLLFDHAGGR